MVRLRRALLASALVLTGALGVATPSASADQEGAPVFTDAAGIHVVSATVDGSDARLWRLRVTTPALSGHTVRIDVLLPAEYAAHPDARYPVLYLFHGTSGGADDWVSMGRAAETTSGLPLITVMPDAGFDGDGGGWFTDWVDRTTPLGASQWETFDIDQLIPFVDYDLRTVADRAGRAVAGLSQGGYGAFSLAARHPDLYAAAASFSGAPDIGTNPLVELGGRGIIDATEVFLDGPGVPPDAAFGSPMTDEINYQGHNPGTLVTNLRPDRLFGWTGNGLPGMHDSLSDPTLLSGMTVESLTHVSTLSFAGVARRAGVDFRLDDYGPGTHSFPYWTEDLQEFVGPLMQVFADPPPAPAAVDYTSVERTWTQWGWTVANHRAPDQAWSALTSAGPHGFSLSGLGSAAVTTPASYDPGSTHSVTTTVGTSAPTTSTVTADSAGRLSLDVPFAGRSLLRPSPPATRVAID